MIKEIFGENIKKRRLYLKMERSDVHSKSGVSVSNIGYIENKREKNNPSLSIVSRLAKALSAPVWMLLTEDYDPAHPSNLPEINKKLSSLSDDNYSKVETYIDDLLKAQK